MTASAVLLASGGLDSTTLAYWLVEKSVSFVPLFLDYGQHCSDTEFQTAVEVLPPNIGTAIERINISGVYRNSSSRLIREADLWREDVAYTDLYLPYRNLLMLTVGAAYAQSRGCGSLYAAFINSNHAIEIDCSAEFFDNLSVLLSAYGSVEVRMPFRSMSKYEVALEGVRLRAPIAQTFSCQVSSVIPCGACPNCVDRLDALQALSEDVRSGR